MKSKKLFFLIPKLSYENEIKKVLNFQNLRLPKFILMILNLQN